MVFFKQTKYQLLTAISTILALNSYFFIQRKSTNAFPLIFDNIKIHYLVYIACFIGLGYILWKFFKKQSLFQTIRIFLLIFLPTEIVFILGLFIVHSETKAHFIFYLITGLYLVVSALFFIKQNNIFEKSPLFSKKKVIIWLKKQGLSTFFILFISLSIFGYFTTNKIENYAGVDEPLWTLDRIPFFWKNIGEMDWKNTSISDKPGITVALISGLGLFDNPVSYHYDTKSKLGIFNPQKDIRTLNRDFRLPLAIFCLLSLIAFYFLIQKLLDQRLALLSVAFISTAPMLIGMSRIINPDAILWVFVPLTILVYLISLKEKTAPWLYLSGILLGLSILTKYVANILYIFFFILIFLEYIFLDKNKAINLSHYLKKAFTHLTSVTLISLITFYFLLPETWVNLNKLFTGTILSQAFISIAPFFIAIVLFLIFDTLFLKNRLADPIFIFFRQQRQFLINSIILIFTFFIFFTFINTYLGMTWVNFQDILSSPKTSYRTNSLFSIFSTNFYPLIFASSPIIIGGLFLSLFYFFKKYSTSNQKIKTILYFICFILIYYLGTTFNGVVSTIRYQVVLYPLLLIVSAIGIDYLIKLLPQKKYLSFLIILFILGVNIITLFAIKPFYLGYASKLLPNQYIVDVKDMGDGSYEAAEYLNNLPQAQDLFIWTDKKGVCSFFVGRCDSFYDKLSFENNPDIDYFVISSGRENKILNETRGKLSLPYNFEKIYAAENAEFDIFINHRTANYVKIIKGEDFKQ
ncbi:MAG: glycosyltransferase family 39 protein [Candidatus Moraniibacteriota bacterium]